MSSHHVMNIFYFFFWRLLYSAAVRSLLYGACCTAGQNCAKKVLESKVLGSLFFACHNSVDLGLPPYKCLIVSVRFFPLYSRRLPN